MTRAACAIAIGLVLGSCTAIGQGGAGASGEGNASAGGELGGQCTGDFGASAAAGRLEAFLQATADFSGAAAQLEGSLIAACTDMGRELGVSEAEMQGQPGQPKVKAVCDPVAVKLQAELSDLHASAKLDIAVQAQPPVCRAKLDAYASCMGQCDVQADPGKLDIKCHGGEIRGKCSAECKGSCAVDVQGECSGSCEGSCQGGCSGKCEGACDGKCSATGSDGSCNGHCSGTCSGTCSAGCKGSCEGKCVAKASAKCEGECRGGCSVAFEEPYCTGDVRAPSADVDCKATCDARVDAQVRCEPGKVHVAINGAVDSNLQERIGHLRAAIEGGMGAVLAARVQLSKLGSSGKAIIHTAGNIPGAIGELGLAAGACAAQAAAILPRAAASVSASVEVSVHVSASASGSAG